MKAQSRQRYNGGGDKNVRLGLFLARLRYSRWRPKTHGMTGKAANGCHTPNGTAPLFSAASLPSPAVLRKATTSRSKATCVLASMRRRFHQKHHRNPSHLAPEARPQPEAKRRPERLPGSGLMHAAPAAGVCVFAGSSRHFALLQNQRSHGAVYEKTMKHHPPRTPAAHIAHPQRSRSVLPRSWQVRR